MFATGDFIESGQQFDASSCGLWTARYMDYIVKDIRENQWDSIFTALSTFSRRTAKEEAVRNSPPEVLHDRIPLPPSDPPSPPRDN